MAEYGSHHATFGRQKPSIFEVVGQENLKTGLRAGFRHLFKFLADNFPERYGVLYRFFDESFTLIDSVFQFIHLRLKGGLFPESFYGLKRIPDPRASSVSRNKVLSWVLLSIVFPYLRSQLEILYKSVREGKANGSLNRDDLQTKLALVYLKIYPVLHFVWETTVLGYYFCYALGRTDYHSPLLHLSSVKLTAVTIEDINSDLWEQNILQDKKGFSTLLWKGLNGVVAGVTLSISVGAFFMQFLEWWYNREGSHSSSSFAGLPIPPPPTKWPCDLKKDICPLCKKKRTNDTVLSSSGFVFCYSCIFHYVRERKSCPVTGYPSTIGQIIKLYHRD